MIDKNQIFSSNELYKFDNESPSINRIEDSIRKLEFAIKHTKHTVSLHQNRKKLKALECELKMSIYHHNKFKIFKVISAQIDNALSRKLKEDLL